MNPGDLSKALAIMTGEKKPKPLKPSNFKVGDAVSVSAFHPERPRYGVVVKITHAYTSIRVRLVGNDFDIDFFPTNLTVITDKRKAARINATVAFGLK